MNNTFSTPSDSFEPTLLPPSADPAQARRDFSRIGLAYAVLTLSLQALATGINYLAYFFAPWILSSWWWTWVISLLPLYGMALPLMWLLLRRIPAAPHNGDYFRYGATVDKPVFSDRVAVRPEALLRAPSGTVLLEQGAYVPGRAQYIRYIYPAFDERRHGEEVCA